MTNPVSATTDERTGLFNVVTMLRARPLSTPPTVTFGKDVTGRYRVEFDYSPRLVALLKSVVPGTMRRWRDAGKCWEVSADWVGPLVCSLLDAGVDVRGLDEVDITEWASWHLWATPISKKGHCAYVEGLCTACKKQPHRPGGLECDRCYHERVARQHRVCAALVAKGLASWPEATPSAGSALRFRITLLADDHDDIGIPDKPDHTAALDAVIAAARDRVDKPPCPICGRRPAKRAAVHIGCCRRLLDLLADRPFTRPRNKAFQAGLCTVCLARPHRPTGRISCEHCLRLALGIEAPSAKRTSGRDPQLCVVQRGRREVREGYRQSLCGGPR